MPCGTRIQGIGKDGVHTISPKYSMLHMERVEIKFCGFVDLEKDFNWMEN